MHIDDGYRVSSSVSGLAIRGTASYNSASLQSITYVNNYMKNVTNFLQNVIELLHTIMATSKIRFLNSSSVLM